MKDRNVQDLVRLNTYLRRYVSPLITRDLFPRKQLPLLLKQQEINTITALVLDMRGFVRTTQSGERTNMGLDVVARLLRVFFSRIIRIAFENYGLVGEFAGDRVLITFGFPPSSMIGYADVAEVADQPINVQRALNTAFAIQRMIEELKADDSFPPDLRRFEVGIGICAGGPAWVGDISNNHQLANEDSWRQELTVISTAVNIAARAEELTKDETLMATAPAKRIIVDKTTVDHIKQLTDENHYSCRDLGPIDVRGLDEDVNLFHLIDLDPDVLPKPEEITEKDRLLVNWICEHIDGAIERDTISKVHRSLSDVGQIIVSSATPDEEVVFKQIMSEITESFKAEKATLYQVDTTAQELVVRSSTGANPLPTGVRLPLGGGIAGWVAKEGEPFISANVHVDKLWLGQSSAKFDPTIHSMMCVPLKAGQQVVGVIQVMDDEIGTFTKRDLAALNTFAGLATVALENARAYDRERRMADARLIITEAFSSATTLDEVLSAVMVAVEKTLSARNATLYLLDPETGELVFEKIISESENPPALRRRLEPGTGIVGRVVAKKKPELIHDTPSDSHWYGKIGTDMRSMICVPLLAKGQTVGAIQVLDQTPHFFNLGHLEILQWLSASAAVAVDNAVRLEQARRKLIASEAIAGLGAIAAKLAHNLKNYVTGIKAIAEYDLARDDPETEELIDDIIEAADLALDEVRSFMQPLKEWEAENIDLDACLCKLVAEVSKVLEDRQDVVEKADIAIEYLPFDQPLFIYAVEDHVRYIFRNLVDNAINAIDEKGKPTGKITLTTSVEMIHEAEWAVVTIEDTGTGISPENIERIFELAFTTRPEGTVGGYGLFWVRLNVERMGGRITTADRPPGVGAVFEVRLPLADMKEGGETDDSSSVSG